MAHPVLASMAYKALDEAARANSARTRRTSAWRRLSQKHRERSTR